jgi:uncharacterized membrane protein
LVGFNVSKRNYEDNMTQKNVDIGISIRFNSFGGEILVSSIAPKAAPKIGTLFGG